MKWARNIRRKISTALLMMAIFTLLFLKNMMESQNVTQLGTSFSSVYEDRLLVESYIYRMSEHLFRKKMMIDSTTTPRSLVRLKPSIDPYNEAIKNMIASYERTKLTVDETMYFEDLKDNVRKLMELESSYFDFAKRGNRDGRIKTLIDLEFNAASRNLDQLSAIQVSEGKLLNDKSQKIVAGASILTKFETGILVAIGLMIMVLVFESTSVFSKATGNQSLN